MWSVDENCIIVNQIRLYVDSIIPATTRLPKSMFLHSLRKAPIFQMVKIPVNACIELS